MNLGSLGGQIVTGFRLNDRGQVIGWATVGDNPKDPVRRRFAFHAFRTAPNRSIDPASDDLAILLGDKVPASVQHILAYDINNRGQVIVSALTDRPPSTWSSPPSDRAFLVDGLRVIEIGHGLAPTPLAINDSLQISGFIRRPGRLWPPWAQPRSESFEVTTSIGCPSATPIGLPFAYPHRQIELPQDNLGHLSERSRRGLLSTIPRDINAHGQVAGNSIMVDGSLRAFRTAPGQPINPLSDDLGTFAGPWDPSSDRGMSRARPSMTWARSSARRASERRAAIARSGRPPIGRSIRPPTTLARSVARTAKPGALTAGVTSWVRQRFPPSPSDSLPMRSSSPRRR